MARTGRPAIPTEVKRRRGTLRPSRLPSTTGLAPIEPLNAAKEAKSVAESLEPALNAAIWLGSTDAAMVALLRDAVADYEKLSSAGFQAREVRAARAEVVGLLSLLGFNPTARAKLGLAEVKARSALSKIIDRNYDDSAAESDSVGRQPAASRYEHLRDRDGA